MTQFVDIFKSPLFFTLSLFFVASFFFLNTFFILLLFFYYVLFFLCRSHLIPCDHTHLIVSTQICTFNRAGDADVRSCEMAASTWFHTLCTFILFFYCFPLHNLVLFPHFMWPAVLLQARATFLHCMIL